MPAREMFVQLPEDTSYEGTPLRGGEEITNQLPESVPLHAFYVISGITRAMIEHGDWSAIDVSEFEVYLLHGLSSIEQDALRTLIRRAIAAAVISGYLYHNGNREMLTVWPTEKLAELMR